MNKHRIQTLTWTFITIPVFLLFWEMFCRLEIFNIHLFPPPSRVFVTFFLMLKSGEMVIDIGMSLQRAIIGYIFGSLLGMIAGILTGRIKMFRITIGQIIQLFRPIPSIAFVPLAILWFGLGEMSKYFLVFWGVFFPVWINTHLGVLDVEKTYIWAAQSLGADKKHVLYEVIIPGALPFIIAGMRIGIAVAFVNLVAAEMAGAFEGVGFRISASHLVFRVDKMFASIIALGALGAGSDRFFSWAVKKAFPWYGATQKG
jgi:ABC-type nitrate/sulfonate/bicarbonate transport system permease component